MKDETFYMDYEETGIEGLKELRVSHSMQICNILALNS